MIEVLIKSITQNIKQINKVDLEIILIGFGLLSLVKVIRDQNNKLDSIKEGLTELNTEGE